MLIVAGVILHVCEVSALAKPWLVYHQCLKVNPLPTKALTSAAIMSLSDAICQRLERSNVLTSADQSKPQEMNRHDFTRTRDVALTGMFWGAPLSHAWFGVLEKIVKTNNRVLGWAIRLMLDAAVFAPTAICGYLIVRSVLAGEGSFDKIRAKISARYKKAVFTAWKFRPAANMSK